MRRYLEPRTDVPAVQDWSTALILEDGRSFARVARVALAVVTPVAVGIAVFLPGDPGNVVAVVVLGLLFLAFGVGWLYFFSMTRPVRRGMLDTPWRRCPATVAAENDDRIDRLLVFDESGTFVVTGVLSPMLTLVLDQQELFLCGPDEQGRVVLRVAGLCELFPARVEESGTEVRPREREPRPGARPLDDPAVAKAFRAFRLGVRSWLWPAVPCAVGAAMVLVSIWPLALAGLVLGGLLVVFGLLLKPMVQLGPYYRQAVAAAQSATEWTALPFTLFPWESGTEVAGLAQVPGGLAVVQFPFPDAGVIANIADTGTIWLAGPPNGAVAVGVPRVPVLTLAIVQPDRDTPEEKPQPWFLRSNEPSLSKIPLLSG